LCGLSIDELVPKRLTILKQLLPGVSQVAVLWHSTAFTDRTNADMLKETRDAGANLNIKLEFVDVRSRDDLERAFSTIAGRGAEALLPLPSLMLFLSENASSSLPPRTGCRQCSTRASSWSLEA